MSLLSLQRKRMVVTGACIVVTALLNGAMLSGLLRSQTMYLEYDETLLIQSKSLQAESKTIERVENDEVCVTTFHRNSLPKEEQSFLLFTAPPPLKDRLPDSMKSWKDALKGIGTYVVVTNDPQTRILCREHEIPTICVEHSDENLPLVDKMFERMHKCQPDGIIAYVNSDISVLDFDPMQDFFDVLQNTSLELLEPGDSVYTPFASTGKVSDYWLTVLVRTNIDANGTHTRHTKGGFDFWAWNVKPNGMPLLPFKVPPFRFPLASYDNWLLDMAIQSGRRNVIDASGLIDVFHSEHKRIGNSDSWYDILMKGVTGVFLNRHFSLHEPRVTFEAKGYSSQPFKNIRHWRSFGTPIESPYKVSKNLNGEMLVSKRKYWSNLEENRKEVALCEFFPHCLQRKSLISQTMQVERGCANIPFYGEPKGATTLESAAAKNWRYTLSEQLKAHATVDGFVLLVSVNFSYREHLMNFKCSLERVGMRDHLVIAAMDEKVYEWGVRRGLPIYLAAAASVGKLVKHSEHELAYGGKGFRSVTKLKSVAVLEVLNAGYSVIWSDVDITWLSHPFEALARFMKKDGGIAIQSNAPYVENSKKIAIPHDSVAGIKKTEDPAAVLRLNSGLYVAPNNALVRAAFQEIVVHAANSTLSEQPSFDHVLCAREPSERGYASCTYRPASSLPGSGRESLQIEVLDRFEFPHGAVLVGEYNDNVYKLGQDRFSKVTGVELLAVHNNWISGMDAKREREKASGWWFTDRTLGCTYHGDELLGTEAIAS